MWYLNIVPLQHYKMRNAPLNSQTFLLWSLLLESSVFISSFTAFFCLESKSNEMKGSFLENKLSIGIIGWLELNSLLWNESYIEMSIVDIFHAKSNLPMAKRESKGTSTASSIKSTRSSLMSILGPHLSKPISADLWFWNKSLKSRYCKSFSLDTSHIIS